MTHNPNQNFERYLRSTFHLDYDHPGVAAFARKHSDPEASPLDNAVRLYYAVRDGYWYNGYRMQKSLKEFKASDLLNRPPEVGGHCIDKGLLLAACTRMIGIPTRLGFANVRNHIATQKLEAQLGNNMLVFHGYLQLWLEGKWVTATPAFNLELCKKLDVTPLDFDGRHDSLFQEYDREGGKFMDYLHNYGLFDDLPVDLMLREWLRFYPDFVQRLITGEKHEDLVDFAFGYKALSA